MTNTAQERETQTPDGKKVHNVQYQQGRAIIMHIMLVKRRHRSASSSYNSLPKSLWLTQIKTREM
ncbi:hypothetical protein GJ744_009696 [Endocarpon pusillum]|uniref:Uncharacterized protein n=1 Tax=Endocarpon pusillum TaxID=364733 RepID=A0A8H7AY57_9EURO|nr:hypothetical protein GJ744_009696 [Endocarpon pusillum]